MSTVPYIEFVDSLTSKLTVSHNRINIKLSTGLTHVEMERLREFLSEVGKDLQDSELGVTMRARVYNTTLTRTTNIILQCHNDKQTIYLRYKEKHKGKYVAPKPND